jgi:monovalent cation/proton antiporter MnhG/PhaG subunit
VSLGEAVVWALLAIGVGAQLLAVLGVLVAGNVYDRLHFTGLASILAPVTFAVAVVIEEGPLAQAGLKSMLTAVILLALSPILVHATARAALVRERGEIDLASGEVGDDS